MHTSETVSYPNPISLPPQASETVHYSTDQYSTDQSRSFLKTDRPLISFYSTVATIGLLIVVTHLNTVQQIIAQICTVCWQMSLIFVLIGLILSFLFTQSYLNQSSLNQYCDRTQTILNCWNIISSVTVVVFTASIFVFILAMPPIA